jgi:hypothetical protein
VGEGLRVGEIVDPNELEPFNLPLYESANNAATDATEPVNRDFRGHETLLSVRG